MTAKNHPYRGFEQGPIRPPSEALSLLIRITRNCPWNRCTFCPVYKGSRFSIRPVDHVKADIDMVAKTVDRLRQAMDDQGRIDRATLQAMARKTPEDESQAFHAAVHWFSAGMRSIFIQDADSLIIRSSDLIDILKHLKHRFYWVERITSYARSHTVVRKTPEELKAMAQAGLNRIHIGMESGSDQVLKRVQKGVTQAGHIEAGLKVKSAGIELSEYVMPGLGGKTLSREHALKTAEALNRIDPDFIRLRTLAIPNSVPLFSHRESGAFEKCTETEVASEILLFIESLQGVNSTVQSDHILNLFEEVNGKLPEDRDRMTAPIRKFLGMDTHRQCDYLVGRRLGYFSRLEDLDQPRRLAKVREACEAYGITPENVNEMMDQWMKRFI